MFRYSEVRTYDIVFAGTWLEESLVWSWSKIDDKPCDCSPKFHSATDTYTFFLSLSMSSLPRFYLGHLWFYMFIGIVVSSSNECRFCLLFGVRKKFFTIMHQWCSTLWWRAVRGLWAAFPAIKQMRNQERIRPTNHDLFFAVAF